jgi:hypothetical protein
MAKKDQELRTIEDYDEADSQAALKCLYEVSELFETGGIRYLVVGGWVPELLLPEEGHIGSIDADFLLKRGTSEKAKKTLSNLLIENGFSPHPEKWFSFQKQYPSSQGPIAIDVDLLTEAYGGTAPKHRSNNANGIKALKITGGDYAFLFAPISVRIAGQKHPIKVVNYIPFLIMKSLAMNDPKRNKPKDAYDIYFVLSRTPDYVSLGLKFSALIKKEKDQGKTDSLAQRCSSILEIWFPSPKGKGPDAIIGFEHPNTLEEEDRIRQSAYQYVHNFIKREMDE